MLMIWKHVCGTPRATLWSGLAQALGVAVFAAGVLTAGLPTTAIAQPTPTTYEDFDRLLRGAERADAVYGATLRRLEEARRLPGVLLRTESGVHVSISDEQADHVAAAVALNVMLNGNPGLRPPEVKGGAQIDLAIAQALYQLARSYGPTDAPVTASTPLGERLPTLDRVGDFVRAELARTLHAYDQENRALLDQEIEKYKRARAGLAQQVTWMQAERGRALPSGAAAGFLNKAGYYVLKTSGSGWRKMHAGWAHKIDGHQNFVLKVEDSTRPPRRESFHWTVPTGVDMRALFRDWQQDARRLSERACKGPPPLCPCAAQPDIWEGTVEYTVISGPYRTLNEARAAAGDSYLANGKPGSTKQWRYDTNRRSSELEQVCRNLGFGK